MARNDLARALALDLDLDLDLARALARALARDLDLDLVQDLVALLGDRLDLIQNLDARILNAIEVQHEFQLFMGKYHGKNECGTTHCRAGAACILHPLGKQFEIVFGNWLAGAVIYQKSTGRVPDFFASDKAAMADIRQCAAAAAV